MNSSLWAERIEVLKIRSYMLYFIGTSLSYFGTGMQFIANAWLVLEMTEANVSVAILLICSTLPGILLSPLLGVLVDQYDRKKLAALMDLFRAIVLLCIPIVYWLDFLSVWHLYLMAFLIAVGDIIFQPTVIALIREIIPRHLLMTANTTTQITAQIGSLVGAGLGGLIVAFLSPIWVMIINAVTFLISAICIHYMRKSHQNPTNKKSIQKTWSRYKKDLADGLGYIRINRHIALIYILMLTFPITLRLVNVLLPSFTKDILHLGAEGFGYIDAAFAIGAVAGGIYLPTITKKLGRHLTMILGMGALAGSLIFFSLSNNLWTAMIGYLLIGLTFQVRILYLTTTQLLVEINYQGRVHSVFTTFVSVLSLGVYLLMGVLSELISQRWLYASHGLLILGIALLSIPFTSSKKLEEDSSKAI